MMFLRSARLAAALLALGLAPALAQEPAAPQGGAGGQPEVGGTPETSDKPAAPPPPPSIADSLGTAGDPGGIRAALKKAGIEYSLTYIGEALGNTSGGIK